MKTDNSCPDHEVLEQLLLGRVPAEEAVSLEDHLAICERCAERAGEINSEDELIVAMQAKQLPPEDDGRVSELIERLREVSADAETSRLGDTHATTVDLSGGTQPELSKLLDPPEEPDEIGRIGQYQILEVLGAGGMGLVLRARDPHLKRMVAIKVMKGDVATEESAKSRFLREAQATAAIEHDNIVTIYQVAEHRELPYYAMQFLRGESLEDRLQREGSLDQSEVLRIGREVAEGLAAAHAEGLLHRDIKPDNIWLEEKTGRAKIVDFGLARDTKDEESMTLSGTVLGTPRYMAPEQALGEPVDQRCDLFSLGSVMYHLATGQPPFAADNLAATLMAVINNQPQPMTELQPELDHELAQLTDRLLAKDPASRFQSAVEVVDAIRQIEQGLKDPTRREPQELRSEPTFGELHLQGERRRRVMIRAALGTLLLAIVFGVIVLVRTQTGTVRVEVNDDNLEVLIDGQKITLTDKKWEGKKKAKKHRLAIKIGDQTLNIGSITEFDAAVGAIKVQLNGVELSSDEFTVSRDGENVLSISYEPREIATTPPGLRITPADGEIDLLALFDPANDGLVGAWSRTPEGIKMEEAFAGKARFPIEIVGSYEFQVEYINQGTRGASGTNFLLPVGNTSVGAGTPSYYNRGGFISGFGGIHGLNSDRNGTAKREQNPEGQRTQLTIQVRLEEEQVTIDVSRNGEPYMSWNGRQDALSIAATRGLPRGQLGMGSNSPHLYYRATLRMLDGEARLLRPEEEANLPKLDGASPAPIDNANGAITPNDGLVERLALSPSEILTSPDGEWTEPDLIAKVNSEANDWGTTVSGDGLTMVFAWTREGGHGITDLWISERSSVTESWRAPQNMGPKVNGHRVEEYPELSSDGREVYLSLDGNVHVIRRVPKQMDS